MNQADKHFSIYIRLRDADNAGNVRCCTCGKSVNWKHAECGHYIDREHNSLRYSEINCNSQCHECNCYKSGNLEKYKDFLITKYGSDIIDNLESAKYKYRKMGKFETKEIAEFYNQKSKDMAIFKCIRL